MSQQKLNLNTQTEKCVQENSNTRKQAFGGEIRDLGAELMKSQVPDPRLRLMQELPCAPVDG